MKPVQNFHILYFPTAVHLKETGSGGKELHFTSQQAILCYADHGKEIMETFS